ncbi:NACHT domain-containing protein [Micromonospora sp. C72]|uniref:NACHT domain-containing protein n=1 Tax=Micromonospora sp. C72 TaxID=2824880 RepID=UPI001B368E38|nr:NACHT domain-containing protein [Micromonospora sp. C72]MBQ1041486.1 NACHT domain-containing protein [Micromonospora sp. C72]
MDENSLVDIRAGVGEKVVRCGTGYRIGRSLVLTAAHVVQTGDGQPYPDILMLIGHPSMGDREWRTGTVVWSGGDKTDLALVRISPLDDLRPPRSTTLVRYSGRRPYAYTGLGFPDFAGYGTSTRHVEQLDGTMYPLSTAERGLQIVEQTRWPRRSQNEPWAGVSGAAIFVDGRSNLGDESLLVGALVESTSVSESRLLLCPITRLIEDAEARRAIGKDGVEIRLIEIGDPPQKPALYNWVAALLWPLLFTGAVIAVAALLLAVLSAVVPERFFGLAAFPVALAPVLCVGWAIKSVVTRWRKRPGATGERAAELREEAKRFGETIYAREQRNQASATYVTDPGDRPADVTFREHSITYRDVSGKQAGTLESVHGFYEATPSRRLVILGEAGSGKTVLATALIIAIIRDGIRNGTLGKSSRYPVPVRFNLANWHDVHAKGADFGRFLSNQLHAEYGLPEVLAQRLVDEGLILPVLDGLDEMDRLETPVEGAAWSSAASRARRAILQINDYHREHVDERPYVLTSRDQTYTRLGTRLSGATIVTIDSFGADEIVRYVRERLEARPDLSSRWEPVLAQLAAGGGCFAERVLRTPWRLMLALTASGQGLFDPADLLVHEPEAVADERVEEVQRQLVGRFARATHGRLTDIGKADQSFTVRSPEDLETWLGQLARFLKRYGGTPISAREAISGTDLNLHTMWPIAGDRLVRFVHVSIHAVAVTLFAVPCLLAVLGGAGHGLATITDLPAALSELDGLDMLRLSWLVGAIATLYVWAWWLGVTKHPWRSKTRYAQVRTLKMRQMSIRERVVAAIEIALAIGGSFALLAYLLAGPPAAILIGLVVGGGFAAAMDRVRLDRGLTGGFHPGLAWLNDMVLATALGVTGAVFFPSALSYPAGAGAVFGFVMGFAGAFVLSLQAWLRYVIAMSIMKRRGLLPWRLGAFLHWARTAGLFRISGTGYQYRHIELQEWFGAGVDAPARMRHAVPGSAPVSNRQAESV